MIIYLAYIRYDPEWCDLVSAHLNEKAAEEAATKAENDRRKYEEELWSIDNPEFLQNIHISHWVSPIWVQE